MKRSLTQTSHATVAVAFVATLLSTGCSNKKPVPHSPTPPTAGRAQTPAAGASRDDQDIAKDEKQLADDAGYAFVPELGPDQKPDGKFAWDDKKIKTTLKDEDRVKALEYFRGKLASYDAKNPSATGAAKLALLDRTLKQYGVLPPPSKGDPITPAPVDGCPSPGKSGRCATAPQAPQPPTPDDPYADIFGGDGPPTVKPIGNNEPPATKPIAAPLEPTPPAPPAQPAPDEPAAGQSRYQAEMAMWKAEALLVDIDLVFQIRYPEPTRVVVTFNNEYFQKYQEEHPNWRKTALSRLKAFQRAATAYQEAFPGGTSKMDAEFAAKLEATQKLIRLNSGASDAG